MADVFVSYKRADFERVVPVVEALEKRGYTVWWDRKLVAGEEWENRIHDELRAASCIVVIWTKSSVNEKSAYASDRIHSEADEGRTRGVLVPALLDRDCIPGHHKRVQFADLVSWSGNADHPGFQTLVAGVERHAGTPPPLASVEMEAWRDAEMANAADVYQRFIRTFPQSRFVSIAEGRLVELRNAAVAPTFFIEDDDALRKIYGDEGLLRYPLPSSPRRIGYRSYPNLHGDRAAELVVRVLPKDWRLSDRIRLFTEASYREWLRFAEGVRVYEARNARCAGLTPNGSLIRGAACLTVQRTSFDDYLRSNLIIDHRAPGGRSLREMLHGKGKLEQFESSELANTIGINVLLVNPTGDVPLQIRSRGVSVRPGQVCSSASGTFELADVPASRARLSQCKLLREVEEELGVEVLDRCTGAPVIVGLGRELARGGQLEIFVVVEADFSRTTVEETARKARDKDEWLAFDYLQLERSGDRYSEKQVQVAVSDLERRHRGKISSPLRAHLSLWFGYLTSQGRMS